MAKQPRGGGITWTEETWNPVRGCSRVSEGCRNCYAEAVAARFSEPGQPYHGLAERRAGQARWTGKVQLYEHMLGVPARWTRPRRIFVNSMSDLFHEALPDATIDRVFGAMALAPHHVFQVLTKRAARAREYLNAAGVGERIWRVADRLAYDLRLSDEHPSAYYLDMGSAFAPWPLRHVWLIVSAEDQATYDARAAELRATWPDWPERNRLVRCMSLEPLLAPVDLGDSKQLGWLRWVIVGGESGANARPFNTAWAYDLVDQCRRAGVACFVKQMGSNAVGKWGHVLDFGRKGTAVDSWPMDLRVREYPS